ncbi:hypothetical protein [Algoriphagus sp.]|uniref:hypothetical protein n=1 Tax=Algoriphagus sp. TaxID=1872435 RepID=UPI0025F07F4A|nr:hypothetical protein [Algoriphagus sp.]
MRKIATIAKILTLTLILISTGTLDYGLTFSQTFQSESIQEAEILNSRKAFYSFTRTNKKSEEHFGSLKSTYTQAFSELPEKVTPPDFSFKNPIFILHCSFLI